MNYEELLKIVISNIPINPQEKPFGITFIAPPGNDEKRGYFFIDCTKGQDAYTYDTGSTSTYYVLEGEGIFEIGGHAIEKNG